MLDVNWTAVVVGAVLAFIAGWVWYSPKVFGTKWASGSKITMSGTKQMPMAPMLAQAVGTFLFAWVIGVTETTSNIALAILIAITFAVLVKAAGLFSQKSKYAIWVDASYILVMALIMILTHAVL